MPEDTRLQRQIEFIVEIDKLKHVMRQTLITDESRQENSAEHSWHIALMALILLEYAENPQIDALRVIKMLLIHDLVEVDAGDTFCYDEHGREDQHDRERQAATRIFSLLPTDQARQLWSLWEEFDERRTANAQFAQALDRLQPLINNYYTGGKAWQKHEVTKHQVVARNSVIKDAAPKLWQYASKLIEDAVTQGILPEEKVH